MINSVIKVKDKLRVNKNDGERIVKMASFIYHFIPASLPTRKAPDLQKLVARQSKD